MHNLATNIGVGVACAQPREFDEGCRRSCVPPMRRLPSLDYNINCWDVDGTMRARYDQGPLLRLISPNIEQLKTAA